MPAPDLLRLLDEHLAGLTGGEFFVALVRVLSQALEVRCSFVTEISDGGTTLAPLAFWCDNELVDVPAYGIAGTPCECVLAGDIVEFERNVASLFPDHREELEAVGAESYLAIPLMNRHGRIMGHLAVIDSRERTWDEVVLGVFRIFATRATAELERRHFENELAEQNAALERRVEERTRELAAANARLLTEVIRVQNLAEAQEVGEARFRTLFEDSPIALWELNCSAVREYLRALDGRGVGDLAEHLRAHREDVEQCVRMMRVQRLNRKTLQLYGAAEPRMLLENLGGIFLPESYDGIGQALALLAAGGAHAELEYWDRTLAGERRLRHVQWSVPEASFDSWNTVIVSIVDVTEDQRMRAALETAHAELEQRIAERTATLSSVNTQLRHEIARRIKTEEALREQQVAYRDLYENAPNVYWSTGVDGLIKRANRQASRMFGYPLDELEGRPLKSLVAEGPDGTGKASAVFQRFLNGEPTYNEEVKFRAADGSDIWASVNVVPVFDSTGKPSHTRSLLTDITARKRLEDQLKLARAEAEAASQAKSDFLASMSHELRTPLNAILGYAQLMEGRRNLDARQHQEVRGIRRAGEHLLTLINDLLDLASVEAGKLAIEPREIRLRGLVREVGEIIGPRAETAGVTFSWQVDASAPEALVLDERRTRQILINLLGNAVKFTPAGGSVEMVASTTFKEVAACEVCFTIRDDGIGIPLEMQGQIFEPFCQLKTCKEGTGLGLSITRRLVSAMGGAIALDSAPGRGSTFTVTLPAVRAAEHGPSTDIRRPLNGASVHRSAALHAVPAEIVAQLLDLARLGDLEAIERTLAAVDGDDAGQEFAEQVRQFSRRYDMHGIRSYLSAHLQVGAVSRGGAEP